jgi:hypothetical protein
MRECPKCLSHYADDLKICRTCGAILEAAEEPPPRTDADNPSPCEEEEPLSVGSAPPGAWTCPQCHQPVPGNFEVCWNCGTSYDGAADPDFSREAPPVDDAAFEEEEKPEQPPAATPPQRECPKCGSTKLVLDVRILDQGQYSDGSLKVAVDGDPCALIFKDRLCSRLTADICGQCGHAELKAADPASLYEHYLQSKSSQGA